MMTIIKSFWQASKVFVYLVIHPGYTEVILQSQDPVLFSQQADQPDPIVETLREIVAELIKVAAALDSVTAALNRLTTQLREFEQTTITLLASSEQK